MATGRSLRGDSMKVGDLVIACWGDIGLIVDIRLATRFNRMFDSYWVVWCDGTNPEWCEREEVSLYESR